MKSLRSKSMFVVPFVLMCFAFMSSYGCSPQQVDTAKSVFSKVSFYSNLARSLITVAEMNYSDKPKVVTALVAAKASLRTLESLVATINAGLDYSESDLLTALTGLISDVFNLMTAIQDAKSVS